MIQLVFVMEILVFSERKRFFKYMYIFEKRVLRRIFGPKRDEVTGDWRKLHNEELHDFYSSPNIIRMIKSRRIIWAGYVARMGKRNAYRILWESQKERDTRKIKT
jgi:hypothetical protein